MAIQHSLENAKADNPGHRNHREREVGSACRPKAPKSLYVEKIDGSRSNDCAQYGDRQILHRTAQRD